MVGSANRGYSTYSGASALKTDLVTRTTHMLRIGPHHNMQLPQQRASAGSGRILGV